MKRFVFPIIVLAVVLGGCSWEPVQVPPTAAPRPVAVPAPASRRPIAPTTVAVAPRRGDAAAVMAERMIGTPYRWGGADLEGFDCSGLVQFSYAQAKLRVPRTTSQQRKVARDISRQALRKGDLVFFDIEGKDNHVGVYLGDSRFVHAPSSGKRVQSASLQEPYYSERFAGAGRIPGADTPVD